MKNHRSVCAASEAGYIEYDGLPGRVKTGCTNTPEQKHRFCTLHKPRVLNSSCQSSKTAVIESILDKKETRSVTHFKVCIYCHCFHWFSHMDLGSLAWSRRLLCNLGTGE